MLTYPQFSPEAFSIGPLSVRWYGFMYLLGFASAWLLGRRRVRALRTFSKSQFDDVLTFGIFGVILGARLGYALFYQPAYYLAHPLEIFYLWHGGMSFHGGLLGVLLAQWLAGRRYGRSFFETMDFMAPLVPPGLFFGRLGNFINGELWGRPTDLPWGMVFPGAGAAPRHPSQLYEAALEGVALFVILWAYSARPRPIRAVSGVFALGYGVFRCFVEFFRQPDAHLGYLAFGFVTMGMVLCLPLILIGCLLLYSAYGKKTAAA
jgi:phosphatidylglycerol:prolipoprotein diacylglycerol transferase